MTEDNIGVVIYPHAIRRSSTKLRGHRAANRRSVQSLMLTPCFLGVMVIRSNVTGRGALHRGADRCFDQLRHPPSPSPRSTPSLSRPAVHHGQRSGSPAHRQAQPTRPQDVSSGAGYPKIKFYPRPQSSLDRQVHTAPGATRKPRQRHAPQRS